jgi:hypothetical protein
MWKTSEMKSRGMALFRGNYWPFVAVTVLLMLLSGTISSSVQTYRGNVTSLFGSGSLSGYGYGYSYDVFGTLSQGGADSVLAFAKELLVLSAPLAAYAGILGLAIALLVTNPYEVGANRFYLENHPNRPAPFSRVAWGFQSSFGNVVLTQFLRALYTFLWSLLFVIPGVICRYRYFAVPYILAENPNLDHNRVLALSRDMMKGYKWNLFLAQFSFIGWFLLSAITLNIVGIFYVYPYYHGTMAEIYRWLRENALRTGIASQSELPGVEAPYAGSTYTL